MHSGVRKLKQEAMEDLSMIGGGDGFVDELEGLKRDLHGWREVLIPVSNFLKWERPFFPAITVAVTSALFLLIWYVDLSVLTCTSLVMMFVGLVDFVVPHFGPSMTGLTDWTSVEEEKYSEICEQLSVLHDGVVRLVQRLSDLRQQNAKFFFVAIMIFFSFTAWIGCRVDNLLLMYFIVTVSLLLPGLSHHGLTDRLMLPLAGLVNKLKSGGATHKDKTN